MKLTDMELTDIMAIGYPLSGLPQYGVNQDGWICTRSYVLWAGYHSREEFGPWGATSHRLTPEQMQALTAAAPEQQHIMVNDLIRFGLPI